MSQAATGRTILIVKTTHRRARWSVWPAQLRTTPFLKREPAARV